MRKVVIEYRIPSFPCNTNIIEFVFASDVLAFLQASSVHLIFLLGGASFNNINLVNKE